MAKKRAGKAAYEQRSVLAKAACKEAARKEAARKEAVRKEAARKEECVHTVIPYTKQRMQISLRIHNVMPYTLHCNDVHIVTSIL